MGQIFVLFWIHDLQPKMALMTKIWPNPPSNGGRVGTEEKNIRADAQARLGVYYYVYDNRLCLIWAIVIQLVPVTILRPTLFVVCTTLCGSRGCRVFLPHSLTLLPLATPFFSYPNSSCSWVLSEFGFWLLLLLCWLNWSFPSSRLFKWYINNVMYSRCLR